jgi:hypothetical protein
VNCGLCLVETVDESLRLTAEESFDWKRCSEWIGIVGMKEKRCGGSKYIRGYIYYVIFILAASGPELRTAINAVLQRLWTRYGVGRRPGLAGVHSVWHSRRPNMFRPRVSPRQAGQLSQTVRASLARHARRYTQTPRERTELGPCWTGQGSEGPEK